MKRKLRIADVVGIVVILAALVRVARHQPEPAYKGKSLAYWLRGFELDNNALDKPTDVEAVEAVRNAGTNAFPILLRMLRAQDSDLRQKLARLAQKQHFMKFHYVTADGQRWAARQGFLALGRIARNAIPQLTEINQTEISGTYRFKYAGEILDLLKLWDTSTREDPAKSRINAPPK